MDLKFACPLCAGSLVVEDDAIGESVHCLHCRKDIVVPQPDPDSNSDWAITTTHKTCPFCSEDILPDAVKCKHCGEFLNGRAPLAAPKQSAPPIIVKKEEGFFLQAMNIGCAAAVIIALVLIIGSIFGLFTLADLFL